MDFLKKVETLVNAAARAALPRRSRRSVVDEQEEKLLVEIRQTLSSVEARERKMAEQIKVEQARAEEAAQQGDRAEQRAHERRAAELERHLEQESIQAINLEEKLAALEEKLVQAREAADKQARAAAAAEEKKQTQAMAQGGERSPANKAATAEPENVKSAEEESAGDDSDLAARKSRLSG